MASNNFDAAWRELVSRAWEDEKLRTELIDNPNKVLAANGIDVPSGVNFVVVENEANRLNLVLPAKPGEQELVGAGASSISEYNAACY